MGVGDDAGEGRIREAAADQVIINADDGDIIGDAQAGEAAGVEDLLAANVVAGEDTDGFGKLAEPGDEGADAGRPRGCAGGAEGFELGVKDAVGIGGELGEALVLPGGPAVVGDAAEAELAEAAIAEVGEGGFGFGADIAMHGGGFGKQAGGADINGGDSGGGDGGGDSAILGADDHAIAAPAAKGAGEGFAAGPFGKVNGPGGMLVDVQRDAFEKASRIGVGGFDEEGDSGDFGRWHAEYRKNR